MPTYTPDQIKRSQDLIAGSKDLLARAQAGATAAPQMPAPAAPPINRTIIDGNQYNPSNSAGVSAAENYLDTFRAPESPAQIAERKRQQSQGLIDSINKQFDDRVSERRQVGAERVQRDNTLSIMTGNMGGSESIQARNKVDTANTKEIEAVNNQRALALSEVYTRISGQADAEAREQLMDATRSAEEILARREKSQASAVENLKLMAQSGAVDYDTFKSTPENKKVFDYALQAVGGSEDALRGLFALNRPQDQILDQRVVGSTMYITYQNPQTGKVRADHFDLGFQVPVEWKNVDLGDRVMFFDPSNPDSRKYYSKGLTPGQAADNANAGGGAPYGKLTASQTEAVSGFDTTLGAATDAIRLLDQGVGSGPVSGRTLQGKKFLGVQNESQLQLEQLTSKIRAEFMKAISGAAVSESEVKRLSKFLPDITDQESVMKSKLQTLITETERQKANMLNTLGATGPSKQVIVAPDGTEVQIVD